MLSKPIDCALPLDVLDARLRAAWPTCCGVSRLPNGHTLAHFTADAAPDNFAAVEAELKTIPIVQAQPPPAMTEADKLKAVLPDLQDALANWGQHTVDARDAVLKMMLWVLLILLRAHLTTNKG